MRYLTLTPDQRSDAWRLARCGRLTASRAHDMMARIKTGEAAARRDLRTQLVVERVTGMPQEDSYISSDMQRGMDLECDAFAAYEAVTGEMARTCGFLAHPELLTGCSPDGLIGNASGGLELKCPKSATHLKYLRANDVPSDYRWQITHALWITGAEWWDFVSFDPRFPLALRLFVKRVYAKDVDLAAYELLARQFLGEVEAEVAEVTALMERAA